MLSGWCQAGDPLPEPGPVRLEPAYHQLLQVHYPQPDQAQGQGQWVGVSSCHDNPCDHYVYVYLCTVTMVTHVIANTMLTLQRRNVLLHLSSAFKFVRNNRAIKEISLNASSSHQPLAIFNHAGRAVGVIYVVPNGPWKYNRSHYCLECSGTFWNSRANTLVFILHSESVLEHSGLPV